MNQKPLWQQYGFASETEFRKRYPKSNNSKPKTQPKKPKSAKRSKR